MAVIYYSKCISPSIRLLLPCIRGVLSSIEFMRTNLYLYNLIREVSPWLIYQDKTLLIYTLLLQIVIGTNLSIGIPERIKPCS